MPNRLQFRPRIIDSFMYKADMCCSFLLRISPERPAEPAFHNFCSVAWEVRSGAAWLVYQQKDGDWALGYLWPGQKWGAYENQPYFVIPRGDDSITLLGTTFFEQLCPEELMFPEIEIPQEAFVHFDEAEVISVGDEWVEIENRQTTSKVYWPDDRLDELATLAAGDRTDPFRYEVDINPYIDWATTGNEIGFDPRIIARPTQPAGSYAWDLETARTYGYKADIKATPRAAEYLTPLQLPS